MIRLTDEEIATVKEKALKLGLSLDDYLKMSAKAQLKKVVELLKQYEQTHDNLIWVTLPHYDWQALLEEVKE